MAKIDMELEFPDGHHVCQMCPFLEYQMGVHRSICLLTAEIIPFVDTSRGKKCPLKFEEDELV